MDLPELDFTNEDTFKLAEEQLWEKERVYQEKKDKERKEQELLKGSDQGGMTQIE
jgi:hypothetical protein